MKRTLLTLAVASLVATLLFAADKPFVYPQPPKGGQVDDYFGTKVADPYRDLENADAEPTKKWIEAENKLTFDYLAAIPERKKINEKLTALWNYEKYTIPFHEGGRYFFSKNTGLQNQNVVFTGAKLPGDAKVLLDPNTLSKDGTVALSGTDITDDGKLMAYGLAVAGSDWQEWKVREIETGKDLPDDVQWVKFSSASWKKDGSGFFYSRYDAPASADQLKQANYFHKLYFHKLGTTQDKDALVYERKDHKDWNFNGQVTEDGRFLILTVSQGTDPKNRVFYKDLQKADSPVIELLNKQDAHYGFLGCEGNTFWFRTDLAAPKCRIVAIDITMPDNITTLVPEAPDTLENAEVVGDRFIGSYLKDAHSAVRVFELSGKAAGEIKLPGLGTASGFRGKRKDTETFYSYVSFTEPSTVYRYDLKSGPKQRPLPAEGRFQIGRLHDRAGLLSEQGRNESADVHHLSERAPERRQQSHHALWLRRIRCFHHAFLFTGDRHLAPDGRRLRGREPARRRRVRRRMAPGRDEAAQTKCVRRFHRRRRMADREQIHFHAEARDQWTQQRRLARRRRPDPASRTVGRYSAGGRRHGHAPVPEVHHRLGLDLRLRLVREQGRVRRDL